MSTLNGVRKRFLFSILAAQENEFLFYEKQNIDTIYDIIYNKRKRNRNVSMG